MIPVRLHGIFLPKIMGCGSLRYKWILAGEHRKGISVI